MNRQHQHSPPTATPATAMCRVINTGPCTKHPALLGDDLALSVDSMRRLHLRAQQPAQPEGHAS